MPPRERVRAVLAAVSLLASDLGGAVAVAPASASKPSKKAQLPDIPATDATRALAPAAAYLGSSMEVYQLAWAQLEDAGRRSGEKALIITQAQLDVMIAALGHLPADGKYPRWEEKDKPQNSGQARIADAALVARGLLVLPLRLHRSLADCTLANVPAPPAATQLRAMLAVGTLTVRVRALNALGRLQGVAAGKAAGTTARFEEALRLHQIAEHGFVGRQAGINTYNALLSLVQLCALVC